ncbi:MAG: hypothetical protein ACRC42_00060, partial [Mycoplasma sp.]
EGTQPDGFILEGDSYYPCYDGCKECDASNGTYDNNKCRGCWDGYLPIPNIHTSNCQKIGEQPDSYYINESTQQYEPCGITCKTCHMKSTGANDNCDKCLDNYYFKTETQNINDPIKPNTCYNILPDGYYIDESTSTFRKCFSTCQLCEKYGTNEINNCTKCNNNSHYYWIETKPTNCVQGWPLSFYLDNIDKIYRKCYSTCFACDQGGDDTTHNCLLCISNYYFMEHHGKNCYDWNSIPDNYYKNGDTFMICHENCKTCDLKWTGVKDNCKECKENFNFIGIDSNYPVSNCIDDNDKPSDYYLDITGSLPLYKKCYQTCSECSKGGTSLENNCDKCWNDDYAFWESLTDRSITSNCDLKANYLTKHYYDIEVNAIRKCFPTCLTCLTIGNIDQNKCTSCNPDDAFIITDPSNCVSKVPPPDGFYYDQSDNTFKYCYITCKQC